LVFGRADLVERLRRQPLARALRVDKLTLAAVEASLQGPPTPTDRYLHADPRRLEQRCQRIAAELAQHLCDAVEVVPSAGAVGGGGAPGLELAGWAVALPERFAQALRAGEPTVIGRLERGRCLLDLRCVEEFEESALVAAVRAAAANRAGDPVAPAAVPD
jgi:L-seryl-tRNA(Ser) seleniumtransferase